MGKRDDDPASLTARQHVTTALHTALQAIPVVGPVVSTAIAGTITERRLNRIESTLHEVAELLERLDRPRYTETEQFQDFAESIVLAIANSTNHEKRRRLRDLLVNAAAIEPGAREWDEAELAARIVTELETPGLALLAAAGRCASEDRRYFTVWSTPQPAVFEGERHFSRTGGPADDDPRVVLPHGWMVICEWHRRLLVTSGLGLVQGDWTAGQEVGFGSRLTPLADMVLRWAVVGA